MKKSGQLYKIIAFVLIFCIATYGKVPTTFAATMTDIRIGLTKLYKDVATIKIKTTKIGLGYSVNHSYICDEEFESSSGFTFQPTTGSYYILNQSYQTYEAAMKVVKLIQSSGIECYPVSIYRSVWKVYVESTSTQKERKLALIKLGLRQGYTFTGPFNDNGHRVMVTGTNLTFLYDGLVKNCYPQFEPTNESSSKELVLDLGARQYRGRIEIGRYSDSSLTAINVVNLESYLYGVVPNEMMSSWPTQALRAQAVCARSYAISKTSYGTDSDITKGYTLEDSISSQVYLGYGSETIATNVAVNATKGEVVTYHGNVIPSYYYSTSGGRTEDIADVWGVSAPYLTSVIDEFETEPEKEPWVVAMSMDEVSQKLKQAGYDVGSVEKVSVEIATVSNRVYSLRVIGSKKNEVLQSSRIREVFDLYSTKFKIISYQEPSNQVTLLSDGGATTANLSDCSVINGDNKVTALKNTDNRIYIVKSSNNLTQFIKDAPTNAEVIYFVGLGYGHGVGLSQSGAKGLAKQGYSYQEIIQYYFKNCFVKKI